MDSYLFRIRKDKEKDGLVAYCYDLDKKVEGINKQFLVKEIRALGLNIELN